MKTDIILCGVGGQGILSIATIIGEAAMKENLYIKQAEVHGMSQRGGDVQSNLSKDGWIITSATPFVNIPNYPDMDTILADLHKVGNVIVVDIEKMAKDNGVPRSANVILLGAAQKALGIDYDKLEAAIARVFQRKGEKIVEANIKALALGREMQK